MENNMEAKASDGSIINTGDTVLVRDGNDCNWYISIFGNKINKYYICTNGIMVNQCIPLNSNEHLCGTNKNFNKPFEFKFGAKVKAQLRGETITGILIGCRDKEKWYDTYRIAINECNNDDNDYIGETYWVSEIKYLE